MLSQQDSLSRNQKRRLPTKIQIAIDDLITGHRTRVTEAELAYLAGESRAKFQKLRYLGQPPIFERDPRSKRIFYSAPVVLEYLNVPVHKSTSEYDSAQAENVSKARQLKR